jgi:tellurite methyltransferase
MTRLGCHMIDPKGASRVQGNTTTTITGFHQDPEGEWVAELACGHSQHMRHRPPWQSRPWVTSAAGRTSKLGAPLDCPLCQMPELPSGARAYKRTAAFTEATVPAGLLRDHRTKAGVWARIVVESGRLEYTFGAPLRTFVLDAQCPGIVVPEAPHQVKPLGPVRFHVEFLRLDGET